VPRCPLHWSPAGDVAGHRAAWPGGTAVPAPRPPARGGAEHATRPPWGAGASPAVPFGTVLVPLVPADSLCALSSGEFVLVAGLAAAPADGRRRGVAGVTVRARCRVVSAPVPARPEPPALPGGHGPPAVRWPARRPGRSRPAGSTWAGSTSSGTRTRGRRHGARCPRIRNGLTAAGWRRSGGRRT